MKRLYDFQKFDLGFFDNLELVVVSEKDKADRKTVTLIILEDRNLYTTGETGLNAFEKIYLNLINDNFKDYTFKQGDYFSIDMLEDDPKVSIWGENFSRNLSVTGKIKN